MGKNTKAPDEPDDASAGRKFGPNEPGMPEQLGSGIKVAPLPNATPEAAKNLKPKPMPNATPEGAKNLKMQKLAKGGTASARADGCAVKGKTKGRFV
jgi:hypothetical protein